MKRAPEGARKKGSFNSLFEMLCLHLMKDQKMLMDIAFNSLFEMREREDCAVHPEYDRYFQFSI